MNATLLVSVAGGTAVTTVCAIIMILLLVNDINDFYDKSIEELSEFKVIFQFGNVSKPLG